MLERFKFREDLEFIYWKVYPDMDSLKFYCKYLILNGKQLDKDFLRQIIQRDQSLTFDNKGTLHRVSFGYIQEYATIYIQYGSPTPHPEFVINTETKGEEVNPRSTIQIEPRQMFGLIDPNRSVIWISNIQKSGVLNEIFLQLGLQAEIKNIYNITDFVEKLKSVNGIRLSTTPQNLFKLTALNEYLDYDVYGYGATSATLELKYNKGVLVQGGILENLRNLFKERNAFDTFIISGRNDGDMDVVFNNDSLVEKVFVEVEPNLAGEYNVDFVFGGLLGVIPK